MGAVTATLELYLYEGMLKKFSNLEYLKLDLLEGDSGYDSYGQMSSALRFVGVASFNGPGTEPDETSFNAEQGFLLASSEADIQKKVNEDASLKDVVVVKASFESINACQPFPNDCRGEIIKDVNTTMILVASLGAVSLMVMGVATLILRRHILARAAAAATETDEEAAGKMVLTSEDTSVSVPSGGEEGDAIINPGCASLLGSHAQVELDDKVKEPQKLVVPRSPGGTPYESERPQEIQIRQLGESEDELDLDYLTMDEDLKSTYFDPSKHAHDAVTLDGQQSCESDEQTLSPE